ncbi:integrin alpha-PS3-like [Anopheles darlingi]|uniref:integrin alpha-PS3-like n=1 Tax=Anopheles darlingi TaxID=43151 RepID=UPI0021003064|nr:integrin alpha-PS3-like [Anopheles darlingi]
MNNRDGNGIESDDSMSEPTFRHGIVVPNCSRLNLLKNNSYFGYAVSSGQFVENESVLYVASAPRAEHGLGLVLIFDYVQQPLENEIGISVLQTITGHQLGEYFGYALLTEDFNNDGLPDLAIAAPMHSRTKDFDNGVVYVYQNKGGLSFELQATLSSSYAFGGRFGTSLGKIGDINRDGYGDMAVGAPHEDNGVVYIFLGSVEGIRKIPSQVIKAPSDIKAIHQPMFGYSISRGVDIDGNGYNDLAIGAPNAEVVYVYRSYPIVKVNATISSTTNRIPIEGSSIEVEICFSREFVRKDGPSFDIELEYRLGLDLAYRRASFQNNASNPLSSTVSIGEHKSCQKFGITVNDSYATARMEESKKPMPIRIELEFNLTNKYSPTEASHFCEQCASIDPNVRNAVSKDIDIEDYCNDPTCYSNLQISSIMWVDIPEPFLIGSSETATLHVQVKNIGEIAHLPKLELTVRANLSPVKLPPGCETTKLSDNKSNVLCFLNNRLPLNKGSNISVPLTFAMSELEADKYLTVNANASSINEDSEPSNNKNTSVLRLKHHSDVGVVSTTSKEQINLNHHKGKVNMTQRVSLNNFGPSYLKDAALRINVPLNYVLTLKNGTQKKCNIINKTDIIIKGKYSNQTIPLKSTENGLIEVDSSNGRHKASARNEAPPINEMNETKNLNFNDSTSNDRSLTRNRTTFFNCAENRYRVECESFTYEIPVLRASRMPAVIEIQFKINLDEIKACFGQENEAFAVEIISDLSKTSNNDPLNTLNTTSSGSKTIVTDPDPPLWIAVSSSTVGLLLFAVISYILYQTGFFNRPIMKELQKLREVRITHHEDLQDESRSMKDCFCDDEEP